MRSRTIKNTKRDWEFVRPKKEKRGAQNGRTMAKSGRHKGLHKCSYLAKLSAQCVGARRPNDGLLNVVNLFWPGTYSNFKFHPGAGSSRPVPVMTRPKNKARAEFEMSKCLDTRLPGCLVAGMPCPSTLEPLGICLYCARCLNIYRVLQYL